MKPATYDFGYTQFDHKSVCGKTWFFSNQIAITSQSGCGSSSALKLLVEKLGYPYRFVSGGSIMRIKAASLGMSIEQFAQHNMLHPEDGHDLELDRMIHQFGEQNFVAAEGRLPHAMMPHAFKVILICDIDIRAERRLQDYLNSGHPEVTYEEVWKAIAKRDLDDETRYKGLYPGCMWPHSDFDLVVDTAKVAKKEVPEVILSAQQVWVSKMGCHKGVLVG